MKTGATGTSKSWKLAEVKLHLRRGGTPISEQLTQQIRLAISQGVLRAGDRLPSTRALAKELGVARGTLLNAVDLLIAEGLLEGVQGSGTFVSHAACRVDEVKNPDKRLPQRSFSIQPHIDKTTSFAINFRPCRPSMEAFPVSAWRKSVAAAASTRPDSDYGNPRGELRLREALCGYLRRARSLDISTDEIMITNGAMHGMHLLSRLFLCEKSVIAFEDPGYPLARRMFEMTGAKILPIPVDKDGLQVEKLIASNANIRLVYSTPSHQFPTGNRLSLQRRQDLIAWAQKNDVLIVEDDYDGEFRYDIAPLPPMAAMSTDGYVVYFGTLSKTLFPALRLGYVVAPKQLIAEMSALRAVLDYQTNVTNQIALARFIEDGEFEKHILRMRRIYAKKRLHLNQTIESTNLDWSLSGTDSGINGLLKINVPFDHVSLIEKAAKNQVLVRSADWYSTANPNYTDSIVIGYGALSTEQIDSGLQVLANLLSK